jgi:hypothetical protein
VPFSNCMPSLFTDAFPSKFKLPVGFLSQSTIYTIVEKVANGLEEASDISASGSGRFRLTLTFFISQTVIVVC